LALSPNQWGEYLDSIEVNSLVISDLADIADGICQMVALLSGYLGSRGGNGCGDSGDTEALKDAQKQLKKVRKALGYTHP
jgi:hypothetical protein